MKNQAPNRLSAQQKERIVRPMLDGMLAFGLGRGNEEAYYSIAGHVFVAQELTRVVARHRHLEADLGPAVQALADIFDRQAQRTVRDGFWAAKNEELDTLQLALDIYRALLDTSPGKQVLRAMRRVQNNLDNLFKEVRDERSQGQ